MGGNCDDKDRDRGRVGGCGPEIDATLRARVKDASVRGSMLAWYTVWSVLTAGWRGWQWVSMTTGVQAPRSESRGFMGVICSQTTDILNMKRLLRAGGTHFCHKGGRGMATLRIVWKTCHGLEIKIHRTRGV